MADIDVRGSKVTFKIDTGASVTAVPMQVFKRVIHGDGKLDKAQKPLYGPSGAKLTVLGSVTEEHHRENLGSEGSTGGDTEQTSFSDTQASIWPRDSMKDVPLTVMDSGAIATHGQSEEAVGEDGKSREHFQDRMVTEVTAGLEGVVCYMDDTLIWGTTKEQHDARVHTVLE
eukprot:superscaffoldBa00000125_g1822